MQFIINFTINIPRPHPTTGEYRSPPFGGDIKSRARRILLWWMPSGVGYHPRSVAEWDIVPVGERDTAWGWTKLNLAGRTPQQYIDEPVEVSATPFASSITPPAPKNQAGLLPLRLGSG